MAIPGLINILFLFIFIPIVGIIIEKWLNQSSSLHNHFIHIISRLRITQRSDMLKRINHLLCDTFDELYGNHILSWKRLKISILSTSLGLFIFASIIGIENTFIYKSCIHLKNSYLETGIFDFQYVILLLLFPILLNFIPDFVSLIETRIVIEHSKEKHILGTGLLIIFDLFFTTTIFVISFIVFKLIITGQFYWQDISDNFINIFKPDGGLVLLLTTYLTSFIWVFAFIFYLIWPLHKLTALTDIIGFRIISTKKYSIAFSGFLFIFCLFLYAIWVFIWMFI